MVPVRFKTISIFLKCSQQLNSFNPQFSIVSLDFPQLNSNGEDLEQ